MNWTWLLVYMQTIWQLIARVKIPVFVYRRSRTRLETFCKMNWMWLPVYMLNKMVANREGQNTCFCVSPSRSAFGNYLQKCRRTCLNLVVFLGKELPEILLLMSRDQQGILEQNLNSRFYVGTSEFFREIPEKLVPKTFSPAVT